jgi:hypothetical protein
MWANPETANVQEGALAAVTVFHGTAWLANVVLWYSGKQE